MAKPGGESAERAAGSPKYDLIFARTSGKAGDGDGITALLTLTDAEGFKVEEMLWTFNMPTDHGRISLMDVRVPATAAFGGEGRGLSHS